MKRSLSVNNSSNGHRGFVPRFVSEERLVFVDIETAGLERWRPIMQIAAIATSPALRELEVFECKVRFDEADAAPGRLRKRNYDRLLWEREGRRPKDAALEFASFLARHATVDLFNSSGQPFVVAQLVAHNAEFDSRFLRKWFAGLGLFFPGSYRVFCTMQRALWLFHENRLLSPPADFKLKTLCDYFEVPLPHTETHDALADVRATLELYRRMTNNHRRSVERQRLVC